VVHSVAVYCSCDAGDFLDEGLFELRRWRLLGPAGADIFEAFDVGEFVGDEEGALFCDGGVIMAEGGNFHRVDAEFGEPIEGGLFVGGADMGFAEVEEFVEDGTEAGGEVLIEVERIMAEGEAAGLSVLEIADGFDFDSQEVVDCAEVFEELAEVLSDVYHLFPRFFSARLRMSSTAFSVIE